MMSEINGTRLSSRRCFDLVRIEMEGLSAVLQALAQLPVEEAVENNAVTKGANVIKKAIIEEAPVDDGYLKKNIKVKRAKNGEAHIHTSKAFYSHIVEFGRSAGSKTLKSGRRVTWGRTTPNPFFTRGFEKSKQEAMEATANEIRKALNL